MGILELPGDSNMQPILRTVLQGPERAATVVTGLRPGNSGRPPCMKPEAWKIQNLKTGPEYLCSLAWGQDTERSLNRIRVWSPKDTLHMMCKFQAKEFTSRPKTHETHEAQPSNIRLLEHLQS